jgi:hypothetical protein
MLLKPFSANICPAVVKDALAFLCDELKAKREEIESGGGKEQAQSKEDPGWSDKGEADFFA